MVSHNLVNIGSGSELLPDGTNPLAEPMLTCRLAFTWDVLTESARNINDRNVFENHTFKITALFPGSNELKM